MPAAPTLPSPAFPVDRRWTDGLAQTERFLRSADLTFSQLRDERVERMGATQPLFAQVFYDMIGAAWRVPPSQSAFVNAWSKLYLAKQGADPDLLAGWKARAARTYPSLVREVHLRQMLEAHGLFVTARDWTLDVRGCDLMATRHGLTFGIHSYVNTARSVAYKAEKDTTRHAGLPMWVFRVTPSGMMGDFKVHTLHQAAWMVKEADRIASEWKPGAEFEVMTWAA